MLGASSYVFIVLRLLFSGLRPAGFPAARNWIFARR